MGDRIIGRVIAVLAALALVLGIGATGAVAKPAPRPGPAPVSTALKGLPLLSKATGKATGKVRNADGQVSALLVGPYYHYTEMHQYIGNGTNTSGADGVAVLTSQHNPYVQTGTPGGGHSLWEVAAESADQLQIIEAGIRKDHNAGAVPRLFVSTWRNGVWRGYDSSNPAWIDNPSEAVNAGTALAYTAAGAAPSIFYQYRIERTTLCSGGGASGSGTGWRVIQKNQGATDRIIGCFSDADWTAVGVTFQKIGVIQLFGETAEWDDPNTCSDQASGVYGTSTSPSAAGHQLAYSLAGAPAGETNVPDGVGVIPSTSSPNAYRMWQDPGDLDEIRWGGTGFAGPTSDYTSTSAGSVGTC